jgi:hypothetical protein
MTATAPAPASPDPELAPRRRWSPLKLIVVAICLLLTVMWVYALFFASKDAAYQVSDAEWRRQAAEICSRYEQQRRQLADVDAGYISSPTPEQMLQRADLVEQATDLLEASLGEVLALPLESERDRSLVADYERYYRIVLADRQVYIDRLRAFDMRPYGETRIGNGPVSNVLIDFVTVNQMKACAPPSDLTTDA